MSNQSDKAAAELSAVIARYAPDYTAPALTNLLVRTSREIGLPKETVIESIERLWELYEGLGKVSDG